MPLFMLSSRLFVNMLSIRVAVEEVMRVGLEIRGERLLDVIRLMNSIVCGLMRMRVENVDIIITHNIR